MNPYSARYLNAAVEFDDPTDENEWKEVSRHAMIEGEMTRLPGAGIITSPMFLNRYPTTETNRNRARARIVLDFFLATDILEVGDRPLDPTESTKYANPTRDDPSCNSCHEVMDPIAGGFQKFNNNDQERYNPDREWFNDMKAPGFGEEQMSLQDFPEAPTWLGRRVAEDARFPYAMVKLFYEGLLGRAPRKYPNDLAAPDYQEQFNAWQQQEAALQAIAQDFAAAQFNARVIVKGILMSEYYRAENVLEEPDEARATELAEHGTGRLSSPMLLARKIEAVTGITWARSWDRTDYLMSDYRILYGGINSQTITKRLDSPNGVMAAVAWRMANELSCKVTALDFSRPAGERMLFRKVETDDAPETTSGSSVPEAVGRIKDNIAYLHSHILGEDADQEEIDRTYALYLAAWQEGQQLMAEEDSGIGEGLQWSCRHRQDWETGEDLPEDQRLDDDPQYTMRAWMAVLSYLFSDYRFLYE